MNGWDLHHFQSETLNVLLRFCFIPLKFCPQFSSVQLLSHVQLFERGPMLQNEEHDPDNGCFFTLSSGTKALWIQAQTNLSRLVDPSWALQCHSLPTVLIKLEWQINICCKKPLWFWNYWFLQQNLAKFSIFKNPWIKLSKCYLRFHSSHFPQNMNFAINLCWFISITQLGRTFAAPWTAACQVLLSITNSHSLLKLRSIEPVMPSNHLILCCSLLLLPSIFPRIRVFSKE